jgi:hypothetical protein
MNHTDHAEGLSEPRQRRRFELLIVIALTVPGDVGTIFAAVSVVANAPFAVTALLVLALAAASLFLAHSVGRGLRLRRLGAARMPAVLVTLLALIWLAVGLAAALLPLATPLNSAGFGTTGASTGATMNVLLAGLLFVVYVGSGLAAGMLGFLTSGRECPADPPDPPQGSMRCRAR